MRLLIIIAFCFGSCALTQAQTDTLSKDSGDPNDPNCPCYHVQQKAENEYQAMQVQQRKEREDSLLKEHRKEKDLARRRRVKQNQKRKKKKDCPDVSMEILQEKRLNRKPFFSYNRVLISV